MFRNFNELLEGARARGPITIAVAAGHDPDVIEALQRARELNLARGILVRSFHGAGGRLTHRLRVTIGTPAENDAFLEAMREVIA